MRVAGGLARILALAIALALLVPSIAVGENGAMSYYILVDKAHPSGWGVDRAVQGQIYHYGTFSFHDHTARSLYLDGYPHYLWSYVEVGQVYYAGFYFPTRHFVAYEDLSYTSSQVLFTYGTCTASTWYTYFIDQNWAVYPQEYRVGRDGQTWRSVIVHMDGGNAESLMERSSKLYDDGHASFNALQYKSPPLAYWQTWDSFVNYDIDPTYKTIKRSNSSWYSTPH